MKTINLLIKLIHTNITRHITIIRQTVIIETKQYTILPFYLPLT